MKHAIFAMTLACAAIALADTVIIENGKPTNACFCNQSAWTATENGLRGTGSDCPIFSWKTFDAGELEISARLSLERLNGCAPRFTIGDVNCGIDGGTGTCFIERQYDKPKLLQDSAAKIEAGKPFTVLIQCKGGNLRFNINGVFIGDFKYPQAKELSISFNPWRATATLQDFRVRGTENGLYSPPRRNEFCARSEERRVGKECRSRWSPYH